MYIIVAGGGPVGIVTALSLSRRGHAVTVVDRDPGPTADGTWSRAGVMQFMHPHGYRSVVRQLLLDELPDVLDALLTAGAEARHLPFLPASSAGLFCRRSVLERTLRTAAAQEQRLTWRTGHADRVVVENGFVRGLVVDGEHLPADVVVVATGRASHLGDEFRGPVEGGDCGFGYVTRMYQALPGKPGCQLPVPSYVTGPDHLTLVLPQDANTHSVLFCVPRKASALEMLRTTEGFERAAAAIPNLAPWIAADRFEPITPVMVGGRLTNTYRAQGPAVGLPPATGLFFVGDAVCTTNPAAGRGLALSFGHVRRLLELFDDPATDLVGVSLGLDLWSEEHIRPWYVDHVRWDASLLRRFSGEDLDPTEPVPSDIICAAATVDPSIGALAGMYLSMAAGPSVLDTAEPRVRKLLASGWRPVPEGPALNEIMAVVPA